MGGLRFAAAGAKRSRPRRVLLWALLSFAVAQLGLGWLLVSSKPQWRDPAYGRKIVRLKERLSASGDRPLSVVVLGSSRTAWGLRGKIIEDDLSRSLGRPVVVFNFGLLGAGPVTTLISLKRLLADGVRPDWLLVEVLPACLLGRQLMEVEAGWLLTAHLRRSELRLVQRSSGGTRNHLRRDWWLTWAPPCYGHRVAILNDVLPSLLDVRDRCAEFEHLDDSGWEAIPATRVSPEALNALLIKTRKGCAVGLSGPCLNAAAVAGLSETLEVCRAERLPVALVLMPEGPALRACYPPGAWDRAKAFLTDLSGRSGVPVIDVREWMAEEDFVDSHHLLPRAAAVFSERLGREKIQPLLRRSARTARRRQQQQGGRLEVADEGVGEGGADGAVDDPVVKRQ